ncbi:MAG: sulfatase-like hydrolase/transferase [Lachnospiraceae bacterium]|nr:sulfatase-like hydrolase/transferase [Lachnospiraceae bacterium]
MAQKKPHIIIFNPDQMRADSLGHLGNPASVTPHLDRFAQRDAISFSNAYCQNPVCVPSRCSFFTGLYPHTRGHRTMAHLLHPGETSLLQELKENGYYVWMNDRNDLTAGQIPGWTESHADEIYYCGQVKRAPGPIKPLRGKPGEKYYYSHYEGQLGLDEKQQNYNSDDEAVDAAIHRIQNPADDRALCMFLGLFYPHPPYQVEEPFFTDIDRAKLPKRIRAEDCTRKAKILDVIRGYQGMERFTETDYAELRAVYLGMCKKIDAQFGRLIQALKNRGIYDDCAIFFLSDHGDFTGDYDLVEKCQNSFEDCLTRVPLLIKPPQGTKYTPGITPALTELVDFYATVMDLAGTEPSHTQFGHSLRPVLSDHGLEHRKYVFCEGGRMPGEYHCDEYHEYGEQGASPASVYWPKMKAQTDDEAHSKGIMIRDHEYKYVSRSLGQDEFYDLKADLHETKNEIDNPDYQNKIIEMRLAMLKWLQATDDIVPYEYDRRFTPEMTWARVRNLVLPEDVERVKQMIAEGRKLPEIMQYCRSRR